MWFSPSKKKLAKLVIPAGTLVSSSVATTYFVISSVPAPSLESLNFLDESYENFKLEENPALESISTEPQENQPQSEPSLPNNSSEDTKAIAEDDALNSSTESKETSDKGPVSEEQESEPEKEEKEQEQNQKEKNKDLIQLNTGGKIAAAILGLALSTFDAEKD